MTSARTQRSMGGGWGVGGSDIGGMLYPNRGLFVCLFVLA